MQIPAYWYLLRARDHVDRHFAEPLDLAVLAEVACCSREHLVRSFRLAYGETPGRYLQRRRIERAKDLLRTTDRRVTDVCLRVGFTSLGSFSTTFKELVGESPSAYRARHHAETEPRPPAGRAQGVPACFTLMATLPPPRGRSTQEKRSGDASATLAP